MTPRQAVFVTFVALGLLVFVLELIRRHLLRERYSLLWFFICVVLLSVPWLYDAYAALGRLVGIKDPNGFRPLCLGKRNGSYVLASETCALDLVEAEFVRELDPGEIVIIVDSGIRSLKPVNSAVKSFCIFEFIIASRKQSLSKEAHFCDASEINLIIS